MQNASGCKKRFYTFYNVFTLVVHLSVLVYERWVQVYYKW